ncbi:unnamed protein product [Clonostachys rhizophaga]|uniref:Uncharacterized protein n=1 Tax=Clonostachys rhizophaga TaxID=160324 RepID=A0A9N9VRT6_9HYPO|nr:unnamed protein product [Clonostachys rhizophaga]
MGMSHLELSHNLADAFNALADEAQGLNDRRIVLEHKLRFAHEQLQYLADKYAPATPEIAETLAKLQLPPHTSVDKDSPVPLPRRGSPRSQHEVALVIRDGRRMAGQLASLGEASKTTASTKDSFSQSSGRKSSMSTALEQDFTVEGKKGNLQCPFSQPKAATNGASEAEGEDQAPVPPHPTPHDSTDPICAAMSAASQSQGGDPNAAAGKCPIRYMDQHSPEEIAHYVETHKHQLPRSHEICLRRYQHNEEQIKKIDSKYGNIVSMIEGLGQLHQPMLPETDQERPRRQSEIERASNERVKDWAKAVTVTDSDAIEEASESGEEDRETRFDRPFKEVRVGESPSRPWGIHVPVYEPEDNNDEPRQPFSPPPAPVRMPSPSHTARTPVKEPLKKCPFDHTKLQALATGQQSPQKSEAEKSPATEAQQNSPFSPLKEDPPHAQSTVQPQPALINPDMSKWAGNPPQMIFTGPVFIGYPVEQAMQIMNQYRPGQP